MTLPALFVSHGAPTLALEDSPAGRFLDALGQRLRPRAVVVLSAHWFSPRPVVGVADPHPTIRDFSGFSEDLFEITWPARSDRALVERLLGLLRGVGLRPAEDPRRGLDHGAWVPLRRMFPAADVPVVPLALPLNGGASIHLALGRALAPLLEEDVLLLASGGSVHNLELWRSRVSEPPGWAVAFDDWLANVAQRGDVEALRAWDRGPHARRAHPTPDHLFPLMVAMGAAGPSPRGEILHRSWQHGCLGMGAFAFYPG